MSNVRSYTDRDLLDKVSSLSSFDGFPKDYWLLGVQSNEDEFNKFDDKFYLFRGENFILTASGTTNAGKSALEGYEKFNKLGAAVIKTNEWYYDLWSYGLHHGKMEALRQVSNIKYYRDNDKDQKAEEIGNVYEGVIYCNFHTNSYDKLTKLVRWVIGGWSACCQVCNDPIKYYRIITLTKRQKRVSYCLIREF